MKRIMIVEDDRTLLQELADIMAMEYPKHTVITFEDSLEAREYARTNRVDVLICEVCLCGLSGVHLAQELRTMNPKVYLLFLADSSTHCADAWRVHANGYLIKPVTYHDFAALGPYLEWEEQR